MHDEHPHPLLAQVPLTLSPFLSLPTSVPLPYSYKTLPSTLPPSILSQGATSTSDASRNESQPGQQASQQQQSPAYVVGASGTTATPDSILSSCVALQQHLAKLEADARSTLKHWEDRRKAADLAEKRRLAPGWLDNDVHILRPDNADDAKAAAQSPPDLMDTAPPQLENKEGEELDRVFGGLKV